MVENFATLIHQKNDRVFMTARVIVQLSFYLLRSVGPRAVNGLLFLIIQLCRMFVTPTMQNLPQVLGPCA